VPKPSSSLLADVFVLTRSVRALLTEALADAPLTPEEYAIYSHVFEEGVTTPTAMATALAAPPTTVTGWTRTMEARGHLERRRNAGDGRSVELRLTAAGRRAHQATSRRFAVAYDRMLANLARREDDYHRRLSELIIAAQAATERL
jgi:DNA-binding MarR family transcriptional regulator